MLRLSAIVLCPTHSAAFAAPRLNENSKDLLPNCTSTDYCVAVATDPQQEYSESTVCLMTHWTKESALEELNALVQEIDSLNRSTRLSAEHTRWLVRTQNFLEAVFGESSVYCATFKQLPWRKAGSFVVQSWNIQGAVEHAHHKKYLRDLDTAKGLLFAAHDELSGSTISDVYKGQSGPTESNGILKVLALAELKLRKVVRNAPKLEREIQDAFENILVGADVEYSREAESIEYSSKKYIPDFAIARLDLAIEIKLCARADREKELISEINDDILAYRQKYRNILFVIYDTGFIRDIDQFADHLEENDGVVVRVVKH